MSATKRERGQATLELLGLIPFLILVGLLAFQAGVAMWTVNSTAEATREAARAFSLDRDPRAAAAGALPGALKVGELSTFGPGHGVRLTVEIPRFAPLPHLHVTRQVVMP